MCTCVRIRSQRYNNFRFRAANRAHNKAMGNAKWGFLTKKSPQGGLKTMAHSTMQEDATDRKPGLPDKDGTQAARLHGIPSHASPHKAEPAWADALQTQHAAPAIAARCIGQRNALHQPSHRTASANGARCTGRCTALRFPARNRAGWRGVLWGRCKSPLRNFPQRACLLQSQPPEGGYAGMGITIGRPTGCG